MIWFKKKLESDKFNNYVIEHAEKWLTQVYISFGSKPKNAKKIAEGMLSQLSLYIQDRHPNSIRPGFLPAYEVLILFVLRQHILEAGNLAAEGEDPSFFREESRAKGKKIISMIKDKLPSPAYDDYNLDLLNQLEISFFE